MLEGLPELLKGNALSWYRNNENEWSGWDDFLTDFRRYFLPRRYQIKLAQEIRDRRQHPGETFSQYVTHMFTLMRRAGNHSTLEKIDRLYENMRAEYKMFVRINERTTLHDLTDQATEYEEIQKAREIENKKGRECRRVNTAAPSQPIPI
ncbi:activity-regulated cytoskeleton associated protein 2 [Pogonomyrmex barbatus]|uniref:Activity-regulated cytoskeleton associated protein 2 n=1 Tax=Pogonomyrmex barbatus TaxID=144034 RepID=A0A8N1S5U9_9HYME|nr:activity-regulated cytoskeleton associated protein 2 [Pogonomyrmex barbatus]